MIKAMLITATLWMVTAATLLGLESCNVTGKPGATAHEELGAAQMCWTMDAWILHPEVDRYIILNDEQKAKFTEWYNAIPPASDLVFKRVAVVFLTQERIGMVVEYDDGCAKGSVLPSVLVPEVFEMLGIENRAVVGTVVIDDDYGGNVGTYISWWNRVREAAIQVRYRGMCISACTIGLSLPREQMCVENTASFGFHLATIDGKGDPEITAALIQRYYPQAVQEWLRTRRLTVEQVIFLSARQIVAMGVMPACIEEIS